MRPSTDHHTSVSLWMPYLPVSREIVFIIADPVLFSEVPFSQNKLRSVMNPATSLPADSYTWQSKE